MKIALAWTLVAALLSPHPALAKELARARAVETRVEARATPTTDLSLEIDFRPPAELEARPLEMPAQEDAVSGRILDALASRQEQAVKAQGDARSGEDRRAAGASLFERGWALPVAAFGAVVAAAALGQHDLAAQAPFLGMAAMTAMPGAPAVSQDPDKLKGVQEVGRALFSQAGRAARPNRSLVQWASDRVIGLASQDEFTKVQILKFTGLLPNIHADDPKIVQSLHEYFGDARILPAVRLPAALAYRLSTWPVIGRPVAWLTGRSTVFLVRNLVAKRFFVGENTRDALAVISGLKAKGREVTVDILGEKSLSQADTDAYVAQYLALLDRGVDNVSIKLTNLDSEFNPNAPETTKAAVQRELRKILAKAKEKGAAVTIDMEHYTVKDLTLAIFLEMFEEDPSLRLALAVQNYLPETRSDLLRIVAAAKRLGARPGVRLVKGANWDRDVAEHLQKGWTVPHFLMKAQTDANYEANARFLLENAEFVRPAFGTHNLRTIAVVIDAARELGLAKDRFEFQHLYGMIPEEVVTTIQAWGYRVRYYTPYGDLLPGLGYLVRRILENSANDSFLRQLAYDDKTAERLLRDPREIHVDEPPMIVEKPAPVRSLPGMKNEYVYGPRGQGFVIVEDSNASAAQIEERLAAPLAAGGKVFVSISNPAMAERFRLSLGGRAVFVPSSELLNEGYVGHGELEWISYLGPQDRARNLRRLAFNGLEKQRSVKRFVSELTPDYDREFLQAKSISENTMRAGFAENLAVTGGLAGFVNSPPVELHRAANQEAVRRALEETRAPAKVLAVSPAGAAAAVAAAKAAQPAWAALSAAERGAFLKKAASLMAGRRFALAALIVRESGKNAESALADVDEAVDFLNYYAMDALRLEAEDRAKTSSGRWKGWRRVPRGVTAVIAPWNFPLAILTGMAAGALAAGNTVVLKPAEQTPATGLELMHLLHEAGLPPGVAVFAAGDGKVGRALVEDRRVDMIAFTGSEQVGMAIKKAAESEDRPEGPKAVVAEMGGKNAIIVDETADVDEAVEGVIASMLGFSGQKCSAASRVIVLPGVRDAFERRLKAKFESVAVGDPKDPATMAGPLIDDAARAKVRDYLRLAREEGLEPLALRREPSAGLDMAIYRNVPPNSRLAREEIFGPVLAILYAKDFDEALRIANDTPFALTGGVFSQTPSRVERAKREFRVGNLYINRNITGAIVGQQPFGGFGHSGMGAHAGGPDYLPQFTRWARPE